MRVRRQLCLAGQATWAKKKMLFLVVRLEQNQEFIRHVARARSPQRTVACQTSNACSGYLLWDKDFPRTASMKIKRTALAEEIGKTKDRAAIVEL